MRVDVIGGVFVHYAQQCDGRTMDEDDYHKCLFYVQGEAALDWQELLQVDMNKNLDFLRSRTNVRSKGEGISVDVSLARVIRGEMRIL